MDGSLFEKVQMENYMSHKEHRAMFANLEDHMPQYGV